MKQLFVFLSLAILVTSCVSSKYVVKPESEIVSLQSTQKFIPITKEELAASQILKTSYELLSSRKMSKLKKYLSEKEMQTPDYFLAEALYYFAKEDYSQAFSFVQKIDDTHYNLLKQLLTIDANYELSKINGAANYNRFLDAYQKLLDRYPDNLVLKELIKTRVRYVRYNY